MFVGCGSSDISEGVAKNDYPITINGVTLNSQPTGVAVLSQNIADVILTGGFEATLKAKSEDCTQEDLSILPNLTIDGVNRISSMRTDPGGKGINVSKVIQKLAGTSIATGILGGETGHSIEGALKEAGLNSFFHYVEGETRTNLKIIDTVSHTNTDINEPGVTVSEEILSKLLSDLSDRIQEGDLSLIHI